MQVEGFVDLVEIGRGGFGVVYRAEQPAHRRTVAIKIMGGGRLDDDRLARFEREAQALGALSSHPYIVSLYGSGVTSAGEGYLVMDHLPGGSLSARIRQRGALAPAEATRIATCLAGALMTAHRQGVVHRDVKPENVLFSPYGEPQLVDFGISRVVDGFETRSGSISATLTHVAPEVLGGASPAPAADQYALGSVLFQMLTGAPAFHQGGEDSIVPLLARIARDPIPDLRTLGAPADLAGVVERAMAKAPTDRYPDVAALGRALQAVSEAHGWPAGALLLPGDEPAGAAEVDDEAITQDVTRDRPPAVAPTPDAPVRRPRRARVIGAVAALAVVVGGSAAALVPRGGDDPAPTSTTVAATTTTIAATTTTAAATTTTTAATTTTTVAVTTTSAAGATDTAATDAPAVDATAATVGTRAPTATVATTAAPVVTEAPTAAPTVATTTATTVAGVLVPNVVGRDPNTAVFLVQQRGLVASVVVDQTCTDSVVVRQSPLADTRVARGATVTITRCP